MPPVIWAIMITTGAQIEVRATFASLQMAARSNEIVSGLSVAPFLVRSGHVILRLLGVSVTRDAFEPGLRLPLGGASGVGFGTASFLAS